MLLLLTIGISFSFSITFVKIINFISMYMITNKIPKFRKNKQLSALGISPFKRQTYITGLPLYSLLI